jgi:hypothetical protein
MPSEGYANRRSEISVDGMPGVKRFPVVRNPHGLD